MNVDWNDVVAMNPRGYLELNDGETVIHGPVASVGINKMDFVEIRLKWRAQISIGPTGVPEGEWKAIPNEEPIVFPNCMVTYEIQHTPTKGPRVRFSGTNILYIEPVEGVNPAQVQGLVLAQA